VGRAIHLLTKAHIESTRHTLCDGGGLYLVRKGNGAAASWIFRFARQGKSHDLGLGPWPEISLTRARDKAFELRRKLAEGVDVLAERGRTQPAAPAIAAPAAPVKVMTFADAAMAYIAGQEAGWTPASTFQWTASLRNLAFPIIGAMPVSKIDTPDVLRVLQPIWTTKATTAGRIRGRIERILDWAKVHGHRNGGENPARWDGHLANVLPAKSRVATIEHFEAVPVAAVPAFMERLRAHQGVEARALEFIVLCAARSGEARGATWSEIDMTAATWTIPAARMKARRQHVVALSSHALAILDEMQKARRGDHVFHGTRSAFVGPHGVERLMLKIGDGAKVHGLRSLFRDWCGETGQDRVLAEMCLAHSIGSAVEQSYARSNLLERRRAVMEAWAAFCAGQGGKT
jgi:integrase